MQQGKTSKLNNKTKAMATLKNHKIKLTTDNKTKKSKPHKADNINQTNLTVPIQETQLIHSNEPSLHPWNINFINI